MARGRRSHLQCRARGWQGRGREAPGTATGDFPLSAGVQADGRRSDASARAGDGHRGLREGSSLALAMGCASFRLQGLGGCSLAVSCLPRSMLAFEGLEPLLGGELVGTVQRWLELSSAECSRTVICEGFFERTLAASWSRAAGERCCAVEGAGEYRSDGMGR